MASPPRGRGSHRPSRNPWLQAVMLMFPEALFKTYCLPPVHFNHIRYEIKTRDGQIVLVPVKPDSEKKQEPASSEAAANLCHIDVHCLPVPSKGQPSMVQNRQTRQFRQQALPFRRPMWPSFPRGVSPVNVFESDFRDDFAQQHVLLHLQELAKERGEVMFIMSQLLFLDYLSQPCYAAAAAHLPRPGDLGPRYKHGEFDILIIHRHYGILIGELKSVGINQADLQHTPVQADFQVAKRVKSAIRQLNRSAYVVSHLISDVLCNLQLTVRKTIFLPYVSRAQLERVLIADPHLETELCGSLGALDRKEATQLCVCSDQISDPQRYWEVSPSAMSQLSAWWEHRMSATNTQLNDQLYLEIVSRFAGPASSIHVHCVFPPAREIKTDSQAISELGWRLAQLVLTLQQIDLMNREPQMVCVSGPPGTGKSIILVLMGLHWLLQGHDVHVVTVFYKSLAASQLVKYQLEMTLSSAVTSALPGRVYFHQYNFWNYETDVERAIHDLTAASEGQELYVLMDEAWFGYKGLSSSYQKLVSELATKIPQLHLWAADVGHINIPREFEVETLTVPLRYCSTVLREVEEGISLYRTVHNYTSSGLPMPAEGPRIIDLHHRGPNHAASWPVLCFQCGLDVAAKLRELKVGCSGQANSACPAPLQFRDVFILTRSSELQDEVTDSHGNVTSQACQFVQGLRAAGVPTCVLNGTIDDVIQWERDLADVAVGETNWVTVAHLGALNGLERKVVVWLPGRMESGDDQYSDEAIEALDRLASVSRCTTQLIIVHMPCSAVKPKRQTQHSQCRVS